MFDFGKTSKFFLDNYLYQSIGALTRVQRTVCFPNARTPLIDAIRERTAEEIVLEIEKQKQLETQDVLSDAGKGFISGN